MGAGGLRECRPRAHAVGVCTALAACLVLCCPSPGAPSAQEREAQRRAILTDLGSGDASKVQGAIQRIAQALEADPKQAASDVAQKYLPAMLKAGRHAEAQALAREAILAYPLDATVLFHLQRARVESLLAESKVQEALAAAKGLYNVCPMDRSGEAIALVAEALEKSPQGGTAKAAQFRLEQLRGAAIETAGPATRASDIVTGQPAMRSAVLAAIQVDGAEYAQLLKELGSDEAAEALIARGNLLLLADRGAEALAVFQQAYTIAPAKQLAQVSEGIARALRAADGTLGRANAFVLLLRPAGT